MTMQTIAGKFWKKVNILGDDECWPWMAGKVGAGYGVMNCEGKDIRANRLAWELTYGPMPKGLCVCHRCDNPPCCNPKHLFLCTHADNMADMARKGRSAHGERHRNAKLTVEQVLEIRRCYAQGAMLQRELAVEYGVTQQQISLIVRGKNWLDSYLKKEKAK